jgi:hypothetical protein
MPRLVHGDPTLLFWIQQGVARVAENDLVHGAREILCADRVRAFPRSSSIETSSSEWMRAGSVIACTRRPPEPGACTVLRNDVVAVWASPGAFRVAFPGSRGDAPYQVAVPSIRRLRNGRPRRKVASCLREQNERRQTANHLASHTAILATLRAYVM